MKLRKMGAFTLAEVLITLGIIGVVAAMTLPTLIQNQHEKSSVARLKKVYSILSQAYLFAVTENGTPDEWGFGNRDVGTDDPEEEQDYIASNAKILKDTLFSNVKKLNMCDVGLRKSQCGLADTYYYENGTEATALNSSVSVLSMIDGMGVMVLINDGQCNNSRGQGQLENTCGWIFVDLNGANPPNVIGNDLHGFYVTKKGIVPSGSKDETRYSFNDSTGHGRTAWVIFNENFDYLHCDGLDWNGKIKCR